MFLLNILTVVFLCMALDARKESPIRSTVSVRYSYLEEPPREGEREGWGPYLTPKSPNMCELVCQSLWPFKTTNKISYFQLEVSGSFAMMFRGYFGHFGKFR